VLRDVPTVSVVIVNWNGRALLDDCLPAVLDQSVEGGHEVIVVDNGSTDGSAEHVRKRFPAVRVLASPPAATWGSARRAASTLRCSTTMPGHTPDGLARS
jgi:glycosyltransferase involved in cell wall biosynthesis